MTTFLKSNSPIALAVEPLRGASMDRAEQEARKTVTWVKEKLEAAGNDVNVAAPRPDSFRDSRTNYHSKNARRGLFLILTRSRPDQHDYSRNAPDFRDVNEELVEKFVQDARENASTQYDMFIAKLDKKCGTVSAAVIEGSHVWGYSFLTVTLADGSKEVWKTQMIVNTSVLGKMFNQFPTRKLKR